MYIHPIIILGLFLISVSLTFIATWAEVKRSAIHERIMEIKPPYELIGTKRGCRVVSAYIACRYYCRRWDYFARLGTNLMRVSIAVSVIAAILAIIGLINILA